LCKALRVLGRCPEPNRWLEALRSALRASQGVPVKSAQALDGCDRAVGPGEAAPPGPAARDEP
jgi:hypothetical protein